VKKELSKMLSNNNDDPNPDRKILNSSGPFLKSPDLPQNFYFAVPQRVIGIACPTQRSHIKNLVSQFGVCVVVNLRECSTPTQLFNGTTVQNEHIIIKRYGVPTLSQVEYFIEVVEQALGSYPCAPEELAEPPPTPMEGVNLTTSDYKQADVTPKRAVAVNCRGGKGRTGTMLCCYLIYKEGITAFEAITRIRELSPGSVETKEQEEFIEEYYRLQMIAQGRKAFYKRSLPNNMPSPTTLRNENRSKKSRPSFPARATYLNLNRSSREMFMNKFEQNRFFLTDSS